MKAKLLQPIKFVAVIDYETLFLRFRLPPGRKWYFSIDFPYLCLLDV